MLPYRTRRRKNRRRRKKSGRRPLEMRTPAYYNKKDRDTSLARPHGYAGAFCGRRDGGGSVNMAEFSGMDRARPDPAGFGPDSLD